MTSALQLIAGLVLAGCTAGAAPVTRGKTVKPAPIVQVEDDLERDLADEPADLPADIEAGTEDDGPEIADEDIPIPDDFESTANEEISDDNLEAELRQLEAEIGD